MPVTAVTATSNAEDGVQFGRPFDVLTSDASSAELLAYTAWVEALGAALAEAAAGRGIAAVPAELYAYGADAKIFRGPDAFLRELGERRASYDWAAAPGADLLGQVYRQIAPKEARRRLGKFYTPDWIIRLVLRRALTCWCGGGRPTRRCLAPTPRRTGRLWSFWTSTTEAAGPSPAS